MRRPAYMASEKSLKIEFFGSIMVWLLVTPAADYCWAKKSIFRDFSEAIYTYTGPDFKLKRLYYFTNWISVLISFIASNNTFMWCTFLEIETWQDLNCNMIIYFWYIFGQNINLDIPYGMWMNKSDKTRLLYYPKVQVQGA